MRLARPALVVVLAGLVMAAVLHGQQFENNFKFNSGQDVQPIFEGWSRNADGSATMHFGYLNRNWVERPLVAVGTGNSIEPGGPDQGQPTIFYPRTNRNVFKVTVPKDWGKAKELTWTLTVNGKTQKAYGWLQPEWEIDPAGGAVTGGRTDDEYLKNKPPQLQLDSATVSVGQPVTLVARVNDDGLPKPTPPKKAAIGQETPPLLQGGSDAPVNVPQVAAPGRGAAPAGRGPFVTWTVWRGPGVVDFEPRSVAVDAGTAKTSARFSVPGDYVLRVSASDRLLTTHQDLRITVPAAASR